MKKKVLFIYPNVTGSMLLPLNMPILSTVLKQNGFDVELFDTTFYETGLDNFEKTKEKLLQVKPFKLPFELASNDQMYKDLVDTIDNYKPDIVALTVVEDTIDLAVKLLNHIKDYIEEVPVVIGGIGATFCANLIKSKLINLVDGIVKGEAEDLISWLVGWFTDMPWQYEKPYTAQVFTSNKLSDLNVIPDYSIFPEKRIVRVMQGRQERMLQVEIDRGCPYQCTYCCGPAIRNSYVCEKYYRQKSVDQIIREMFVLKNLYDPTYFDFSSETFLLRPTSELKEFMQRYRKEIDIPFWCQTRPETITESKLKLLKEGGIADIQFGIEHGNEQFRKEKLNRKGSNELIKRNLVLVEKHKIPYTVNMIMGFAEETREQVFDSINFMKGFSPKTINVYLATAYKGTMLYNEYIEKGYLQADSETQQLLGGNTGLKRLYMTDEEVKGLQRCFPLYSRLGKSFYDQIRIAERLDEEGNKMFSELREIYIKEVYGL